MMTLNKVIKAAAWAAAADRKRVKTTRVRIQDNKRAGNILALFV